MSDWRNTKTLRHSTIMSVFIKTNNSIQMKTILYKHDFIFQLITNKKESKAIYYKYTRLDIDCIVFIMDIVFYYVLSI